MHWEWFSYEVTSALPPSWLSDNKTYSRGGETERGDQLAFRKKGDHTLDLKVAPSWGGPFQVDGIAIRSDIQRMKPPIRIIVEWVNPWYRVFINAVCILAAKHDLLSKSSASGVPFASYIRLPRIDQYCLARRPEPGEVFELGEIPRFLSGRYRLINIDPTRFINASDNNTQNARELFDVWSYAHLLATDSTAYYSPSHSG